MLKRREIRGIGLEGKAILKSAVSKYYSIVFLFTTLVLPGYSAFASELSEFTPALTIADLVVNESNDQNALKLLTKLSPNKLARVLDAMNFQLGRQASIVKALAKTKSRLFAQMLTETKEPPFDGKYSRKEGKFAAQLLFELTTDIQEKVLSLLKKQDADFECLVRSNLGQSISCARQRTIEPVKPSLSREIETRDTDSATTPEVAQREYIFTDLKHHRFIQTHGLGPCIAVALFHPKTHTAALAHIDGPTLIEDSIERLVGSFLLKKIPASEIIAHVSGGDPGGSGSGSESVEENVRSILNSLARAGIRIGTLDVLTPPPDKYSREVELDLKTGDFYYYSEKVSLPQTPAREKQKSDYIWFNREENRFLCGTPLNRHPESMVVPGIPADPLKGWDCSVGNPRYHSSTP